LPEGNARGVGRSSSGLRGAGDLATASAAAAPFSESEAGTTEDRPDRIFAATSPRPNRPGLVTLYPVRAGEPFPVWRIAGAADVGRSSRSSIRLDDTRVSRRHALMEVHPTGIMIRDARSRHGSFVQGVGVPSEGALAKFGSIVRFGDTLLLATADVDLYRVPPRRLAGERLGLPSDMIAGPCLAQVWDQAARAAKLKDPVLILGESGTGKECVARIVHAFSELAGPFVGINVAAVPDSLFEAELFGHERGAFTGATTPRRGAFREATGGVLFLDEIGDLRSEVQGKLLRTLDLGRVRPLGASRDVQVETRIVSSTSRDLREACEAGTFRGDLWYRLSGIVIQVPPLRERPHDLVLLALAMMREQAPEMQFSTDALERLLLSSWNGNARQLRYAVSHGLDKALAAGNQISVEHLPELDDVQDDPGQISEERIRASMLKAGGVAARAAAILGVSRTTFYSSLNRLNIDVTSLRK